MVAALSLTIAPASAAEVPFVAAIPAHSDAMPVVDVAAEQTSEHYRRGRYHRYRYRRGPGLGDVIAGVLIVGAIAHIAKNATREDRRDRDYRRDVRWDDDRGIDRAVEMCVDAIERESRVETVERADRTARGWQIEGTIAGGDGFTCLIGEDGRIDRIDYGAGAAPYDYDDADDDRYDDIGYEDDRAVTEPDENDRQWDDDRYASEWSRVDRQAAKTEETASAFPGGPVDDGEQIEGDLDLGTGYPGAGA